MVEATDLKALDCPAATILRSLCSVFVFRVYLRAERPPFSITLLDWPLKPEVVLAYLGRNSKMG